MVYEYPCLSCIHMGRVLKTGRLAVESGQRVRLWRGLLGGNGCRFEGRRNGGEAQGAGVVQWVWIGVEMWERGYGRGMKG